MYPESPQSGAELDGNDQNSLPVQEQPVFSDNSSLQEESEIDASNNQAPLFQQKNRFRFINFSKRRVMVVSAFITLFVLLLTVATIGLFTKNQRDSNVSESTIPSQEIELDAESSIQPNEITGEQEALYVTGDIITKSALKVSKDGFVVLLQPGNLTADQNITLPNDSGTLCLDSNNCDFATTEQIQQLQNQIGPLQNQLGQIVIPSIPDIPASSLVNNQVGAVSIQGTSNRISVTTSNGTIKLSTPQDLATISSPTFANMILTGNLNVGGTLTLPLNCSALLNGGALTTNGAGQVICSNDDGGGSGTVDSPGGTPGAIPLFTAAQTIADSIISQALGTITVSGDLTTTGDLATTNLTISGLSNGFLRVDGSGVVSVNTIDLGTDTDGNYVLGVTGGNGVNIGGVAGEGWTPSVSLALQANKGLEVDGNGLSLIDCGLDQVLKYNGANQWACAADADNDTTYTAGNDIDFNGTQIDLEPILNFVTSIIRDGGDLTFQTTTSGNIVLNSVGTIELQDDTNVAGQLTANGGLLVEAGDNFTVNNDTFTDLTGNGLQVSANALTLLLQANKGLEVDGNGLSLIDCGLDQVLKYNGANQWACAADNGAGSAFTTIDTPGGTDPVADSSSDTLQFIVNGTNLTIVGADDPESITFDIVESVLAGNGLGFSGDGLVINSGNGIQITGDAVALGPLTANWNQTGAFDIILNNSGSELIILDSDGTHSATFDVGNLTANATYTFIGASGLVLTDANYAATLDPAYVNVGESPAAGDVSGSFSGGLLVNSVQNNSVDLGTDTVGDYVASFTAGAGLTGNASGEGSTPTLAVGSANGGIVVNADDIALTLQSSADALSSTTSSGSGLEILAGGLTLLQGCSDGEVLKWNETSDTWGCAADGAGSGVTTVGALDGQPKSANGAVISGNNIYLQTADGSNPGLVSTGAQTFAGNKTFTGNLDIQGGSLVVGLASTNTGSIAFHNATNANTITLQSGVTGASYTLTLPTAVGSANQCLKAQNGTGTLFWDNCLGGGGGGGITSINSQTGPSITINNASGAGNAITIDDAVADGSTKGIAAFNSTNFSSASGVINTIQNINTAASPQFTNLTLTGDLDIQGGTATIGTNALAGNLVLHEGDGDTADLVVGSQSGNQTYTFLQGGTVITSGNIAANAVTTVAAGNGLTGGGGPGAISLDIGAGNGIAVNANDITLSLQANKGLEVDGNGLSLIDCANGEILKYNGSNQWACAADAGGSGVGDDIYVNGVALDNADFLDTAASATDASTTWSVNAVNPDEITLTIGAATGTEAGIVTANAQAFGGTKTFNGQVIADSAGTGLSVTNNATVGGQLSLPATGSAGGIVIGGDTNLYRTAANGLATDDAFLAALNITAQNGAATSVTVGNIGSSRPGVVFGSAADTNLYRSAANTLATDDAFTAGGLITASAGLTVQAGQNLTVNSDVFTDLTGNGLQVSANALTLLLQANKGLEVDGNGLSLIDCANGEILKYNGSNQWACAADNGTGAAPTLQDVYDNSASPATILTADAKNIEITLANTATDANFILNVATGSTGEFKVQNNGTDVLQIGSAGQLQIDVQGSSGGILLGGDAQLYRSSANRLQLGTDDTLRITNTDGDTLTLNSDASATFLSGIATEGGNWILAANVSGDGDRRFTIDHAGELEWGDGTNPRDTNLYRSAANTLATDDSFSLIGASSNLTVQGTGTSTFTGDIAINGGDLTTTATTFNLLSGATTALNIGPAGAVGSINLSGGSGDTGCTIDGTTGNLTCSGNITSTATSGDQGWWDRTGTTLSPTNAGDIIQTSGSLRLTSDAGTNTSGILFGSTQDTNLYRAAANILHTDGTLRAGTTTNHSRLDAGGSITTVRSTAGVTAYSAYVSGESNERLLLQSDGQIWFGSGSSAVDTNLYRSAANVLATNDSFSILGGTSTLTVQGIGKTAINLSDTTGQTGITVGGDTNLWRSGANQWTTEDSLIVTNNNAGGTFRVQFNSSAALINADIGTSRVINNGTEMINNHLQNPGFEYIAQTSQGGWDTLNGSLVSNATNARTGNGYFSMTANSTNQGDRHRKDIEVIPGQQYYGEIWLKPGSTTGQAGLYIQWFDKDNASLGFSNGTWTNPGSTASYVLRTVNATAPASAVYGRLFITLRSDATTGTWFYDDAYFTRVDEIAPQIFKNSADSTAAFQIQNSAGTSNLLVADTTNTRIGIGTSAPETITHLRTATNSDSTILRLDTGTLGANTGTAGIQFREHNAGIVAYENGFNIGYDAGTNQFNIQAFDNNTTNTVASFDRADGSVLFQNFADSTTGFQVQRSGGGGSLFTIDTSNSRLSIGSAAPANSLLTIGTNTTTASGGITFGTDTNLYRSDVGTLQTDSRLHVQADSTSSFRVRTSGGTSVLGVDTTNQTVGIGSGGPQTDAKLYVSSSTVALNRLNNTGGANDFLQLQNAGNARLSINSTGQILFADGAGGSLDTNLYRSAANTLKTDDNLLVQTATNSTTALQVQNSAGVSLLQVDTTPDSENLVTNGSFEINTTGWAAKNGSGTSTLTRVTTQQRIGAASMRIATTGADSTNAGARYDITLANSTNYALHFWAKLNSGTMTDLKFGYSSDGTQGGEVDCDSGQTVITGTWLPYTCTFTTPASNSGTPYIYISQAGATNQTYFIDGVKLRQGTSQVHTYKEGLVGFNSHVGIGTYNPLTALQVAGGDILLDNGARIRFFDSSGNMRDVLGYSSANNVQLRNIATTGSVQIINANAGGSIQFATGASSTVRGRFLATGEFNLGATTAANSLLSLDGTGVANGITIGDDQASPANLYHNGANTLKTDDSFIVGIDNDNAFIVEQAGGTDVFAVDTNGAGATGITIGGGTQIEKVLHFAVDIDPAAGAANTATCNTGTVTGAATTDRIVANPDPADLENSYSWHGARVSSSNTIEACFVSAADVPADPGGAITVFGIIITP